MKSEDIIHAVVAAGTISVMIAVAIRTLQYDPFRGLMVHYVDKRINGAVENSQHPGRLLLPTNATNSIPANYPDFFCSLLVLSRHS